MILSINLRGLVNAEYYQLLKLVVDKVDEANATTLKIKKVRDDLAGILPALKSSLNAEVALSETKVIQDLDQRRDDAIIGLQMIVKGNTRHINTEKKDAANLLKAFFKAQGSEISRLNYQAETSVLDKITDKLKSDAKYIQAIALLGLDEWVAELETSNQQFETVFKSRNTEISASVTNLSFGELKKQSIPVYSKLMNMIESRYATTEEDGTPTAPYQNLINEINALVEAYNSYISKGGKTPDSPAKPA